MNELPNAAYDSWRNALSQLTSSEDAARLWRERRYRFAHRLGESLVGRTDNSGPITGPAVYGVWLAWGLLYVGQTLEAERRLRDLAVGESHHLANTFPPEIWTRVVVVAWPELPEAERPIESLRPLVTGLALEHRLQVALRPLANSARRTGAGLFRNVDASASRSLGARNAADIEDLYQSVQAVWTAALDERTDGLDGRIARGISPARLI